MFEGFARLRTSLTTVAFLRRISRELHRANELAETRLGLDHPAWRASTSTPSTIARRRTKFSDLNAPSIDSWNDVYREQHPESTAEPEQDDLDHD